MLGGCFVSAVHFMQFGRGNILFLLQAGAKHVYGLECSAIADQAKRIVSDNGYADRVTIIKGKVSCCHAPLATRTLWNAYPPALHSLSSGLTLTGDCCRGHDNHCRLETAQMLSDHQLYHWLCYSHSTPCVRCIAATACKLYSQLSCD